MNLRNTLPFLFLAGFLSAQMVESKPQGGGMLKIGEAVYRFEPMDLRSAPPRNGLPAVIRLEGRLVPVDGSPSFHLILTLLKDGSIYLLKLERKTPGGYPDSWAATLKTRTHLLKMEDHPGGIVELRCEGRLTGIMAKRPQDADWSGILWASFPPSR